VIFSLVRVYRFLRFSCFLFIFFYSSGDPRHLHSFPTRRSSDLPAAVWGDGGASVPAVPVSNGELPPLEGSSRSVPVRDRGDLLGDRKSTRLNSSHSQISYAVFCLKKKKKKNKNSKQ